MCNSPKKFIPQEQRSHKKSEQQSITPDFKHKTNIFCLSKTAQVRAQNSKLSLSLQKRSLKTYKLRLSLYGLRLSLQH